MKRSSELSAVDFLCFELLNDKCNKGHVPYSLTIWIRDLSSLASSFQPSWKLPPLQQSLSSMYAEINARLGPSVMIMMYVNLSIGRYQNQLIRIQVGNRTVSKYVSVPLSVNRRTFVLYQGPRHLQWPTHGNLFRMLERRYESS